MLELQILTLGFGLVFIAMSFALFFTVFGFGSGLMNHRHENKIVSLLGTGCFWSLFVFVLLLVVIVEVV